MKATQNGFARLWTNYLAKLETRVKEEQRTGKTPEGKPIGEKDLKQEEENLSVNRNYVAEANQVHRILPTITYKDKLTFYHGGREFQLFSLVGDAPGTTAMYLPKEKILVTGDILVHPLPYATPPLGERIETLKKLLGLEVSVLVPGHGEVENGNKSLLTLLHFLESIHAQVQGLLEQGVISIEEVQAAVNMEEFRAQFIGNDKSLNDDFDQTVKALVKNAYREGRDGHEWKN
jgi:glyoxylase-like metal-dependent hydrolase (beta-lactamase superfamily II)